MTRLLPLALALLAATPALAQEWQPVDGSSASQPYAGLVLVDSTAVAAPDGGMQLVTFWAHPAPLASDPAADGTGPSSSDVTRCVTDLGPDLAVLRDRCWQSQP